MVTVTYDHIYRWGNNSIRAARKGQRCRVIARGAMRSVLVEFEDGHRMVTSARAVSRLSGREMTQVVISKTV